MVKYWLNIGSLGDSQGVCFLFSYYFDSYYGPDLILASIREFHSDPVILIISLDHPSTDVQDPLGIIQSCSDIMSHPHIPNSYVPAFPSSSI
jgi:hypothetical protein